MPEYQFRPLGDWQGPSTRDRQWPRFKAGYQDTLDLLESEIDKLDGKHIVLQVDLGERDIRIDGLPRSNARFGAHPGVVVSFESRFGPLRYATDEFTEWKANLRAIALSLKALRDVDRYGVIGWFGVMDVRRQLAEMQARNEAQRKPDKELPAG